MDNKLSASGGFAPGVLSLDPAGGESPQPQTVVIGLHCALATVHPLVNPGSAPATNTTIIHRNVSKLLRKQTAMTDYFPRLENTQASVTTEN